MRGNYHKTPSSDLWRSSGAAIALGVFGTPNYSEYAEENIPLDDFKELSLSPDDLVLQAFNAIKNVNWEYLIPFIDVYLKRYSRTSKESICLEYWMNIQDESIRNFFLTVFEDDMPASYVCCRMKALRKELDAILHFRNESTKTLISEGNAMREIFWGGTKYREMWRYLVQRNINAHAYNRNPKNLERILISDYSKVVQCVAHLLLKAQNFVKIKALEFMEIILPKNDLSSEEGFQLFLKNQDDLTKSFFHLATLSDEHAVVTNCAHVYSVMDSLSREEGIELWLSYMLDEACMPKIPRIIIY